MNPKNDLPSEASRITQCVSEKGITLPKRKGKQQLHGMRIPFIFALVYLKMRSSNIKSKMQTMLRKNVEKKGTTQKADDCLAKQDFHLRAIQESLLENTLTKKTIVDWKLPGTKIQVDTSSDVAEISHPIKVLSQTPSGRKEKEANRVRDEQLEIARLQKEERQFNITRIVNYFTK